MRKPRRAKKEIDKDLFDAIQQGTFDEKVASLAKRPGMLLCMRNGHTLLRAACIKGDYKATQAIIQKTRQLFGEDELKKIINRADTNGSRPISFTVRFGYFELTKRLIEYGAEFNFRNRSVPPLFSAISNKDSAIVTLLLAHSADLNIPNYKGETVLHAAVQHGQPNTVQHLMKFGADMTIKDNKGYTPLRIAIDEKDVAIIALLFTYSTSFSIPKEEIEAAYNILVRQHYPILSLLTGLELFFHIATIFGYADRAQCLIEAGADIHAKNKEGYTPLEFATNRRKIAITSLLLTCFADSSISNEKAQEAYMLVMKHHPTLKGLGYLEFLLHLAVRSGFYKRVKHLLKKPHIRVNAQDSEGNTPLHIALIKQEQSVKAEPPVVIEAHQKMMNRFLSYLPKENLNIQNLEGQTLLHLAIDQNNAEVVKYLIYKGARVDLKNKMGHTPLQLALIKKEAVNRQETGIIWDQLEIIELLVAYENLDKLDIKAIDNPILRFPIEQKNDFLINTTHNPEEYPLQNQPNTYRF